MVRARRLVPRGNKGSESITYRTYDISQTILESRRRRLIKAGYIEEEISRMDNGYEAGLLSLTKKEVSECQILSGRRNHIYHIKKADPTLSREEAKGQAIADFRHWGGIIGRADDYIDYYYGEKWKTMY